MLDEEKALVDSYSDTINRMVDEVVNHYCSDIDNYIKGVSSVLHDDSSPITDRELEYIIMLIPAKLYSITCIMENVGIKSDISKLVERSAFNESFTTAVNGSIPFKTAQAELDSIEKSMVKIVYDRAYKQIRARYDIALELLQSAKKVLGHHALEIELSRSDMSKSEVDYNN